ncbi:MAG TPA: MaoC family dehydratase N-terminal domain-containing protein, partial [Candidatus Acidoferrum sp.]|nr:MaoC family dehydratase N-terminal domain-containing protein [Candidatus Acidoferrum sp.]
HSWIGRRSEQVDWVTASRVAAWNATLDRDEAFPGDGDPVPPLFHLALFPPLTRQSELGPDGHAPRGGFLPPVGLPRRMWAGGRFRFHCPLRVGERATKVSVIDRIEEKRGRSGALVFVTVRHAISGAAGLAIEEEQDLVYRDAPRPGESPAAKAAAPAPAPAGEWRRQIAPDDVLLFRYSALTFNGHRIHYDRRYATEVEGYPGLVVHGPLLATLLVDLVRRERPGAVLESFRFTALRPTFDVAPFTMFGEPDAESRHVRLWSTDGEGATAVEAEATILSETS